MDLQTLKKIVVNRKCLKICEGGYTKTRKVKWKSKWEKIQNSKRSKQTKGNRVLSTMSWGREKSSSGTAQVTQTCRLGTWRHFEGYDVEYSF
jgi:hypothetical protein